MSSKCYYVIPWRFIKSRGALIQSIYSKIKDLKVIKLEKIESPTGNTSVTFRMFTEDGEDLYIYHTISNSNQVEPVFIGKTREEVLKVWNEHIHSRLEITKKKYDCKINQSLRIIDELKDYNKPNSVLSFNEYYCPSIGNISSSFWKYNIYPYFVKELPYIIKGRSKLESRGGGVIPDNYVDFEIDYDNDRYYVDSSELVKDFEEVKQQVICRIIRLIDFNKALKERLIKQLESYIIK